MFLNSDFFLNGVLLDGTNVNWVEVGAVLLEQSLGTWAPPGTTLAFSCCQHGGCGSTSLYFEGSREQFENHWSDLLQRRIFWLLWKSCHFWVLYASAQPIPTIVLILPITTPGRHWLCHYYRKGTEVQRGDWAYRYPTANKQRIWLFIHYRLQILGLSASKWMRKSLNSSLAMQF